MCPERWLEIKAILQDALDMPPSAREEWLNNQRGVAPEVLLAVRRLLSHEDSTHNILDDPPEIPADLVELLAFRPSFEIGQVIADRFVIVRKLGQGGMGEVFEAEDRVGRERIAIKTVLTDMTWDERSHLLLKKEVQLARQVTHPNVCRIHEIFVHHFTSSSGTTEGHIPVLSMELLPGRNLAAYLQEEKAADLATVETMAIHLADALAAAHGAGVVHGDFKPANIILVPDKGKLRPVVTDFGLAFRLADSGPGTPAIRSFIAGTPAYMAPEQFAGEAPTPASDVYGFGLVLFEMLTGSSAFPPAGTIRQARVLAEADPPPIKSIVPAIDNRLERIVSRCLERDPARRYASGIELRSAFQAAQGVARRTFLLVGAGLVLGAAGLAAIEIGTKNIGAPRKQRSIAILPFRNSSNEDAADYLVDGLTSEVRRCVQRIPDLRVVARESSAIANSARISFTELGKQLSVTHVLAGSVRALPDRLTTHVQVFEAASSLPMLDRWFESTAKDAISLEIEIAAAVADALQLRFDEARRKSFATQQTSVPEAYNRFLLANHYMQTRTTEDLETAGTFYLDALKLDPNYALAWAALANQRQALSGHPGYTFNDLVPEAERYALKAKELSPDLPEALSEMGRVEERYRRQWAQAERLFQEAVGVNPNFTDGMNHLSGIYSILHRHDEAIAEAVRAVTLDPLSVSAQNNYAYVLRNARRFAEALNEVNKAVALNPEFSLAHILLADILSCMGVHAKARDTIREAIARFGDAPNLRGYLAIATARGGDAAAALGIAEQLEGEWREKPFYPSLLADVFCALVEREKMYYWLDVAVREHDAEVVSVSVDPSYDRFRDESRFQDVLRGLNLEARAA